MPRMGITCPKCGQLLTVYYARDFRKRYGLAPGLKDRDTVVIKAKCPKHGSMKRTLNPFNKEFWMDDFAQSMLRCMKCDKTGTIGEIQEQGHWLFFRINCPEHGLTDLKKVVSSLFYTVTELQKQGISYAKYQQTQAPSSFTICPKCQHIVAPGSKFCEKCGASVVPE